MLSSKTTKEIDLAKLTPEQIIEKVQSGEIDSCEYHTTGEYLKAMYAP